MIWLKERWYAFCIAKLSLFIHYLMHWLERMALSALARKGCTDGPTIGFCEFLRSHFMKRSLCRSPWLWPEPLMPR